MRVSASLEMVCFKPCHVLSAADAALLCMLARCSVPRTCVARAHCEVMEQGIYLA